MQFIKSKCGDFYVAQTDPRNDKSRQIVLACGFAPMPVYYELKQLFYNLVDFLRAKEKIHINLHIIAPIRGNEMLVGMDDYINKNNIDGIVIANDQLAHYFAGDSAMRHLNYILPRKGSNKNNNPLLPKNPYKLPLTYTVPTNQWLRTGSNIKTEGSGVNLLGYVLNALKFIAKNENEIDISYLHDMDKYPVKPTIIKTIKQFKKLMKLLVKAKRVAIDTEATSLNKVKTTLLTVQFCIDFDNSEGQNLFVLPISHRETPWDGKQLRYIAARLRRWLTMPSQNRWHIYQNAKFDLITFINQMDVQWFSTPIFDVMAGVFSLDENSKFLKALGISGFSLEYIEQRAGFTRPPELVISKEDRGNMAAFSLKDIAQYGAYDVLTIFHIAKQQMQAAKNRGYPNFDHIIKHIGRMQMVFAFMEARGVLVDKKHLQQLASPIGPLADRINAITKEMYATKAVKKANKILLRRRKNVKAGDGLFANKADPFIFDVRNTDALQVLFFEVEDLEPVKKRKDGGGSVDKGFQKKYKDTVKTVKLYADRNKLTKLKNSFADSILKTLNESEDAKADGRIRNSYWFITVLTGRTSATDPNMQQIPSRGEDADIIKLQFITEPGKILIKPDFSAHEIRVTGLVSKDRVIKKTFKIANEAIRQLRIAKDGKQLEEARLEYKKNGDIHILNVRFFYNMEVDNKHPLRTDVKVTVFQTIYGSQAPSLGRQINKTTEEAQELMDKLFETWPEAKEFMDGVKKTGSKNLRVFSPISRPRHLWAYLHPDKFVGYAMDRRGPNSIMQGLASDIGIEASYKVQEEIYHTFLQHKLNFDGRLLIMVHDSMTNEVSLQFAPIMMYLQEHGMTTLVQDTLQKDFNFKVDIPFGFDMKMGLSEGSMKNWSELRRESAEKIFRDIAKDGDKLHRKQLDNALYNLDRIWKIRERELRDDPYKMLLQGRTKWYAENMRGMHTI